MFFFLNGIIRDFIEQKPSLVFSKNIHGDTLLHYACKTNNVDLVQDLLIKKANLFTENNRQISPLLEVCKNDAYNTMQYIVTQKPQLLFETLQINHHPEEIIAYCLNNRLVDVNTRDDNGFALLHHLCSEQFFNQNLIAYLLFIHNADLSIKNNDDNTAIDILDSHSKEKARLLAMYKAQYDFLHISDDDEDCPICLMENDDAIVFVSSCCKNRMHFDCYNQWITQQLEGRINPRGNAVPGTCTLCRQQVAMLPEKGRYYFNNNFIEKIKEDPNYLYTKLAACSK